MEIFTYMLLLIYHIMSWIVNPEYFWSLIDRCVQVVIKYLHHDKNANTAS